MGNLWDDFRLQQTLQRYLREPEEPRAQQQLQILLDGVIPAVEATLRHRFALQRLENRQEAELDLLSVRNDALLQLTEILQSARQQRHQTRIRHLRGFTCRLAVQAFGDYLDGRYPERRRLKHRLRYLFGERSSETELKRWNQGGVALVGLAAWTGRDAPEGSPRWNRLEADPMDVYEKELQAAAPVRTQERALCFALLQWLGHPLSLDDLTNVIARILGLQMSTVSVDSGHQEEDSPDFELKDPALGPQAEMLNKENLREVWRRICRLPQKQRLVLVLGLGKTRRREGDTMEDDTPDLWLPDLLYAAGIAALADLAAALEMGVAEFAAFRNRLPLSDQEIAAYLGITANYVGVLRNDARKRLERMGMEGGMG